MNDRQPDRRPQIGKVLAEGWRLTRNGMFRVFPWVLGAEVIGALPVAGAGGGLLDTDLARLAQPSYLIWLLLSAFLQTLFYATAISKLARYKTSLRGLVRVIPALLFACLIYEVLVMIGFGVAVIFLLLTALLLGILPGFIAMLIPLAPTAWISTALAFFAYPVVLERRGPFAALGRSLQLAKSHWAHAAVVVSVPAIGLLCVAMLRDVIPVMNALHAVTHGMPGLGAQASTGQLQNLLASIDARHKAAAHPWWDAFIVCLSALAWWYALAVCYVEYLALQGPAPLTVQ